jgi:hypothetical protein
MQARPGLAGSNCSTEGVVPAGWAISIAHIATQIAHLGWAPFNARKFAVLHDHIIRSMLIRMTGKRTRIVALLAAASVVGGSVAAGTLFGADAVATGAADRHGSPIALVIDASLARDGRQLVDPRLEGVDAEVRLPRNSREATTNVRYFEALDYRVYVAGPRSTAAAERTGVDATAVDGLDGALAAPALSSRAG